MKDLKLGDVAVVGYDSRYTSTIFIASIDGNTSRIAIILESAGTYEDPEKGDYKDMPVIQKLNPGDILKVSEFTISQ